MDTGLMFRLFYVYVTKMKEFRLGYFWSITA